MNEIISTRLKRAAKLFGLKVEFWDDKTLDSVFYFDGNSQKIKELRKKVEVFEENVKQRARIIEQEERLKKEKDRIEKKLNSEN